MRRLFLAVNCALLALAFVVLVPVWALADMPPTYTSYGYAAGVHEIAGTDAFPNFQNGAINNRYPLAQVQQDASPSSNAIATYIDSGPLAATGGSQYNQSCSGSGSQAPPPQICQNPNNQVPYANATYPGGPPRAHVDACNGCGNPPEADSVAAQLSATSSAVYVGVAGQPFGGASGQTSTVIDSGGTLTVITHSEVDSFVIGTLSVSKVVVDVHGTSTVSSGGGSAQVEGGQVTFAGHQLAITDQGVTVEEKQAVPCTSAPKPPGVTAPSVPSAPAPPANPVPGLPVGGTSTGSSGSGTTAATRPSSSSGCLPTVDVTYIKLWTVAPTRTVDGSHVTIWATGLHVLVTHPSPGPGVPTQSTQYVLGEGFADLQAGSSGGPGFAFGGFGGSFGGFGGFGGFGDTGGGGVPAGGGGGASSAVHNVATALAADRVPLALMFLTLEALLLASAAAWVWSRNAPTEAVPDEALSP